MDIRAARELLQHLVARHAVAMAVHDRVFQQAFRLQQGVEFMFGDKVIVDPVGFAFPRWARGAGDHAVEAASPTLELVENRVLADSGRPGQHDEQTKGARCPSSRGRRVARGGFCHSLSAPTAILPAARGLLS